MAGMAGSCLSCFNCWTLWESAVKDWNCGYGQKCLEMDENDLKLMKWLGNAGNG